MRLFLAKMTLTEKGFVYLFPNHLWSSESGSEVNFALAHFGAVAGHLQTPGKSGNRTSRAPGLHTSVSAFTGT